MIYCLKLLFIGLITLPLSLFIILVGPFDRSGRFAYAVGRLWTWTILKTGNIRLKVRGLERLEPGRPYIFISNHQSNLDIPVLVQSLPKFQLRWIAKKQLAYVPFFGWALWAARHILVDRIDRGSAMESFRKAKQKLSRGDSVVIFAEGTRSSGGHLLPFKRGGFLLAIQTKIPIVPVVINGSWTILPRGDWRVKAGEIEVVVGEPVSIDDRKNLSAVIDRVRAGIESHTRGHIRPYANNAECAPAKAASDSLTPG